MKTKYYFYLIFGTIIMMVMYCQLSTKNRIEYNGKYYKLVYAGDAWYYLEQQDCEGFRCGTYKFIGGYVINNRIILEFYSNSGILDYVELKDKKLIDIDTVGLSLSDKPYVLFHRFYSKYEKCSFCLDGGR